MIISLLKIIYFILLTSLVFYFFIASRKRGCRDPNFINYDPDVNIHDPITCIPKVKGCMDKNANNYNLYANIMCEEDCIGCELKGTCELCKKQEKCSEDCRHCICSYNKTGCNRSWALNYDKSVTGDNNSCITKEEILRHISVISGGSKLNCSNRVIIRVKDKYPIIGGNYGMNVVIIERGIDLNIRYIRHFNTGRYKDESIKFINFMKRYVHFTDIVVIAVRGDAVGKENKIYDRLDIFEQKIKTCETFKMNNKGQKIINYNIVPKDDLEVYQCKKYLRDKYTGRYVYDKGEKLYLSPVMMKEVKLVFKDLGSPDPQLVGDGSYILIGSYLKDIFYETSNTFSDVSFPTVTYSSMGCYNLYHTFYKKELINPNINKMLVNLGNVDNLNLSKIDVVKRCALEAAKLDYPMFSISNRKCKGIKYIDKIVIDRLEKCDKKKHWNSKCEIIDGECICPNLPAYTNEAGYPESKYLDELLGESYFLQDLDYNYYKGNLNILPTSNKCYFNKNFELFGNQRDECIYSIDNIDYDGKFEMRFGVNKVQTFSSKFFSGTRRDFSLGFHESIKKINKRLEKYKDTEGYEFLPIASLKIPPGIMVSLYRFVSDGEDLTIQFTKEPYYIVYKHDVGGGIEDSVPINKDDSEAYNLLKFTYEEGALVTIDFVNMGGEEYAKKYSFRTGRNILKNIKFNRYEINTRVVLFNNGKEIFNKFFSIKYSEDIKNFKNLNLKNRIGYIETLDKNDFVINKYEFTTGNEFQKTLVFRKAVYEKKVGEEIPKVLVPGVKNIQVLLVDPDFKSSPLALNLIGLLPSDNDSKKKGLKMRQYENIGKDPKPGYTNAIQYINVQKINNVSMGFQNIDFTGKPFKLVRGRYNLPNDYVFFLKSILLNSGLNIVFRFFAEDDFVDEHIRIYKCDLPAGNDIMQGSKFFLPNLENFHEGIVSKKIKSVIVERADQRPDTTDFGNEKLYDDKANWGICIGTDDTFGWGSLFLKIGFTNFTFGFNINKDPIIFNNNIKYVTCIDKKYVYDKNKRKSEYKSLTLRLHNNKSIIERPTSSQKRNGLMDIKFVKNNRFFFNNINIPNIQPKMLDGKPNSTFKTEKIGICIRTYKNLNLSMTNRKNVFDVNETSINHTSMQTERENIQKEINSGNYNKNNINKRKKKISFNGKNVLMKQFLFKYNPIQFKKGKRGRPDKNNPIQVNNTDYCIGPVPITEANDKLQKIKFLKINIGEITMIFKRKHIVMKKIIIPKFRTTEIKIKGVDVHKVTRDEVKRRAIFHDKANNIIGYDNNIGNHNYIWGVIIEPSVITSEIEYYPKEAKWIIKNSTDDTEVDSAYVEYTSSDLNINKNIVGKKFIDPLYTGYYLKQYTGGIGFQIRDRNGYTDLISGLKIS
jgi:hypothetical protein